MVKHLPTMRDLGSILVLGRSPGEGNSNPLQYSCLENPMGLGTCRATVHGVAKSQTRLSDFTFANIFDSEIKQSLINYNTINESSFFFSICAAKASTKSKLLNLLKFLQRLNKNILYIIITRKHWKVSQKHR